MSENERRPGSAKRQILHGTNLAIYIVVVLAIIVLCNWFVNRNDHHLDLTPNKEFSLSPQTRKLLKGLDRPVSIYVFDRESGFRERRDLMNLYSSASHFVQGHGERDLSGSDRDGYSKFKQALQNEDSDVKTLVLLQKMEIPSDCSMLVIAGPKNDYLPQEVSTIEKYLKGGGRLLAFLDPGVALPNLSKLLSDYGVTVRNDLVIDENPVAQLFGTSPSMPLILSYGDSPIVQPLKRTATLFPLARSFEVASDDKSGATLDQLCKTSQASFSVTNFNPSMREVSFRPGKDIKGPLVVAVAGTLTGGAPNKEGRFVAVGTSLIAANAYLGFQGNRDLIMNMVEWLASNEGLISIRPKAPAFQHLNLTASQMGGLLLRVMIIPVCIIIIGIGVWWSRR